MTVENINKKEEIIENTESQELKPKKVESVDDRLMVLKSEIERSVNFDELEQDRIKLAQINQSVEIDEDTIKKVKNELNIDERLTKLNGEANELKRNTLETVEVKTILQKIRNSVLVNNVIKSLVVLELITLGEMAGKGIYEKIKEKNTKETEAINKAKEYSIKKNIETNDVSRFFKDDFISGVALTMKSGKEGDWVRMKESLIGILNSNDQSKIPMDKQDSLNYEKWINKYNSEIDIEKSKLSEVDKEKAREKMIDMVCMVEKAKLDLTNHIQSDEYLEKLSKEMGVSKETAKLHQKTRIDNINNLSYDFKTSNGIHMDANYSTYAYYDPPKTQIVMPHDIDLNDKNAKDFFFEAAVHEILHESTQASKGMSLESWSLLHDSFIQKDSTETKENVDYYSNPVELIVRKQILDLEMEKLGIKKYGEVFTEEHYKKLRELRDKYEISWDAIQLIDHIKPEEFCNMMNSLANLDNSGKNYYNPGWDYEDKDGDNKA